MHSTRHTVSGGNAITVLHNGDYSGRIEIVYTPWAQNSDGEKLIADRPTAPRSSLMIDMSIILAIAAKYRRDQLVERLENMSTEELMNWTELHGPRR